MENLDTKNKTYEESYVSSPLWSSETTSTTQVILILFRHDLQADHQ